MQKKIAGLGVATLMASLTTLAADAPPVAPTPPAPHGSTLPGAVDPGTPPPAPTEPAKPKADIDAAAQDLMKQSSAAYKALTSFAANIEVKRVRMDDKPVVLNFNLAYQRTGQALLKATDPNGVAVMAADGQTLLVSLPTVKGKYLKKVVPKPGNPASIVLSQVMGAGPGIGAWLSGDDLLDGVMPSVTSLKVGPASKDGDVDLDSVILTMTSPAGVAKFSFAFAKGDHLLRTVVMEQSGKGPDGSERKLTVTETHTNLQPNAVLTPSTLTFVPPAGAVAAQDLDAPLRDPRLKVGATPIAIKATDTAGKAVSLDQYKGKVTLIDFWASWCQPCMMELPNVLAAYQKYHAQGFEILGVSLDEKREAMDATIKARKMTWRQIFDGKVYDGAVPSSYGITAIPNMILVGRDGKIAALDIEGGGLASALKAAMAKKPAATVAKGKKK